MATVQNWGKYAQFVRFTTSINFSGEYGVLKVNVKSVCTDGFINLESNEMSSYLKILMLKLAIDIEGWLMSSYYGPTIVWMKGFIFCWRERVTWRLEGYNGLEFPMLIVDFSLYMQGEIWDWCKNLELGDIYEGREVIDIQVSSL